MNAYQDGKKSDLKKNIWRLSWASFFTDVHSEMLLPVLPFFMRMGLGASYTIIGAMEGFTDGLSGILKVWSGHISDRTGSRKPMVVLGYALSWVSKLAMAAAAHSYVVFMLRTFDRLGKGIRTSPRDALLADSVKRANRGGAFGLHRTMDTLGAILGTLLSMTLLYLSWSYSRIFLTAAVPGFLALIILVYGVKESSDIQQVKTTLRSARISPTLWLFITLHGLFGFTYLNYALMLLFGTEHAKASVVQGTGFYLWFNVVYASAALPIGRWSDTRDERPLLGLGYLIFWGLYLSANLRQMQGILGTLFLLTLYGFGTAFVETLPRSYIGKLVSHSHRATVLGIYHGLYGISAFLGNTVMGWLWQTRGSAVMMQVLLTCCSATTILFFAIMHRLPRTFGQPEGLHDSKDSSC